jgi:hypothetical protein
VNRAFALEATTMALISEVYRFGAPAFDKHQFVKRSKNVSKETRLAFNDIQNMHVERRQRQQERRLPTPEWVMKDDTLRDVVLKALEGRMYIRNSSGTDAERMARIEAESHKRIPKMKEVLAGLANRYSELSKKNAPESTLNRLATEIQNKDTEICMAQRGITALMLAAVYNYYRLGWNSTEIADELQIKPPMIRIWLYRLNKVHRGEVRANYSIQRGKSTNWTGKKLTTLFVLRATGHTFEECAKIFCMKSISIMAVWRRYFGSLNGGCTERRRGQLTHGWSPQRIQMLKTLRARPMTWQQVADQMELRWAATAQKAYKKYCV